MWYCDATLSSMRATLPTDIPGKGADGNRPHLVILEREPAELRDLAQLVGKRFDVRTTASQEECLRLTRTFAPAAVIVDAAFVNSDIIPKIKELRATAVVFVAAQEHDVSLAFRASKAGADDMIVDSDSGRSIEARLLAATSAPRMAVRNANGTRPDFSMLFGTSPKMEDIKLTIDKVAETNATVLIRGESGTGKEMVARMVYQSSGRADKPFVKVNCAAIPYEL